MIVGFVHYNDGEIPFALDKYRLELFSIGEQVSEFAKEYNHKTDYLLHGSLVDGGAISRSVTFLVERSMGGTCYLRCYVCSMFPTEKVFDSIGFQSPVLDDVFRYKYVYLDVIRAGENLALKPKEIYNIPFSMNNRQYALVYRIGYDNRMGLLEDYKKDGEIVISLDIQECYDLSVVLSRLASFMTSRTEEAFKKISLYHQGKLVGWFFCPLVSEKTESAYCGLFYTFTVMDYIPKVLNNIALDAENMITKSIPLGYLGNCDTLFSPQRFMEQIVAFEFLYEKYDPQKGKKHKTHLKDELSRMIGEFPELLIHQQLTAEDISEQIKEIRRSIAHGYAYYYDFRNDPKIRYYMLLLDRLLKQISLLIIGFSKEEISKFPMV